MLRLPPDLDLFIEEEAARSRRSKNSEILFRLEQSRAETSDGAEFGDRSPAAGDHQCGFGEPHQLTTKAKELPNG